jgi:hypothetical protein
MSAVVAPVRVRHRPRSHFLPLHASLKRRVFTCCHRRAGKTVAIASHLDPRRHLTTRTWPPPRAGPANRPRTSAIRTYFSDTPHIRAAVDGEPGCVHR